MKREKNDLDKIADALIENNELLTQNDIENLFSELKGKIYQAILEGEMNHHLGYKSNDKGIKNTQNRRNGYSSINKKVRTNTGEITISMPRDRDGSFEPIIIKKRQRILDNMDDSIISMYAKGMTQRDIVDLIKNVYRINVSTSFISDIVSEVSEEVKKWKERPLNSFYPFVYIDCLYTDIKENLISVKRPIYVMIGIDITGHKEVLGLWIGDSDGEGAYFWSRIFDEIKSRGVEDILYISLDGLNGLSSAIEDAFPNTKSQRCIVHLCRNLHKKSNKKDVKEILQDFKKIYQAPTEEIAMAELENFKQKHKNDKNIVKTVESYMTFILPLFEVPIEIRKVIYTTNPIESVNSALRKVTRGKGSFPNEEAVMKILYLRIRDLEKKWQKQYKGWNIILNQLIELFGDRVNKYISI